MRIAPILPSGLADMLPPAAAKESRAVARLLASFAGFGYQEASPALLEFEASLLSGRGEALAPQTFRLLDPLSQSMLGLRADITLQMARLAASRLHDWPRPLRLCYAGPIIRTMPEPLQSERQLTQAGIELIGPESVNADAEAIIVAGTALGSLGIEGVSIDIHLAGLLSTLAEEATGNEALKRQLHDAVAHKDVPRLAGLPLARARDIIALIEAAGDAARVLPVLERVMPSQARHVARVMERAASQCGTLCFTLDPLDASGFDYHHGVSFSIFARGLRFEAGRGGRYGANEESATGFTLYVTQLLSLLPDPDRPTSILLGDAVTEAQARRLRAEGWATLYALDEDIRAEAKRLGCLHMMQHTDIEEVIP